MRCIAQLRERRLHAFLDVFETEPIPPESALWHTPNLVITPHVGGGATDWEDVANRLVRDQVERWLRGAPLANVVTDGY